MSLKPVQAFACCLLALAFSAPAFAAGDTIKLGVAGAHSGELSSYGVPTLNAAHLVVDQYNAKGGVMGKQIEIIAEDDQCKPEIAPNAATKLISDGVNVVLGHICSGATKAAQPLYNNAKIVAMSPSATTPSMTESRENPYFFRTVAKDNDSSTVSAKFAVEGLKSKKVAILHDNSEYGKGYADGCAAYLKEAGVEVVLFEAVTPGAADYSSAVRKVRQNNADLLMWGGYYPEASKILANMHSLDIEIPLIGPDGLKDAGFLELAGDDAEGVYAAGPSDTAGNPLSIEYAKLHQEKYGTAPGAFFDNAVSAAIALLNAIDKAQSTDSAKIMDALHNSEVDTPVGLIKFDDKGDAIGVGMSVYQIKDGAYVSVF
ncbi:MAG: branched-chain amino acid ABC transporter substrate-binding protein [Mailhella sp.]|nr:branched-chain amino acid ABC transporter substrate-binding protein [Mailhella sp.]